MAGSKLTRLRAGIACVPWLFTSALVGFGCGSSKSSRLQFFPAPGTIVASPSTEIAIRGAQPSALRDVAVSGSRTGRDSGKLVALPDSLGSSFVPAKHFDQGERVNVSLRSTREDKTVRFHFTIARSGPIKLEAGPPGKPTGPGQVQSFRSMPDLHPVVLSLQAQTSHTAPGDVFVAPSNKLGQAGPLILDKNANAIWFHPLPGKDQAFDFRSQQYDGRQVLTWWQGLLISRGFGVGEDVIFDRSYRQIATVKPAGGYRADGHEFLITPQGTAIVLAYNPVREDLSSDGGPREGTVIDGVIQELDIRAGRMVFEWHSLGNVALSESYNKPAKDGLFDYFHINSVDVDTDGNLLVSARNTWAIYKINHLTGQIMWRLGGKKSSFKMGAGTRFAYQHDARRQPDGTITLFDNGATPTVHPESRAIALKLDDKTMRASLNREWTHPGKLLAGSQGNMQTLPGGDRFIGWGAKPNITEFNRGGSIVFDAALAGGSTSYRAYRFPWTATPTARPAVASATVSGDKLAVYASWNGATNFATWRILGGDSRSSLKPITDVPRAGFETTATVLERVRYLAAEAQDSAGHVIGTSATITPGGQSP